MDPTATIRIEIMAHEGDATATDLALRQYRGGHFGQLRPEIGERLRQVVEEFLQQHGVEAHVVAF